MKLNVCCYYGDHIVWGWKEALWIIFWATGRNWGFLGRPDRWDIIQFGSVSTWNSQWHRRRRYVSRSRVCRSAGACFIGLHSAGLRSAPCSGSSSRQELSFPRWRQKCKRAARHLIPARVKSRRPRRILGKSPVHPPRRLEARGRVLLLLPVVNEGSENWDRQFHLLHTWSS